MEFLASLPSWAIMAVIGGVIGALTAGVVWALRDRIGAVTRQILIVVPVALGLAVTNLTLLPAIERSDAGMCRTAERGAEEANRLQAGAEVDSVTTFGAMVVDCDARSVVYELAVTVPEAELPAGSWDLVHDGFNQLQCEHPVWRDYIDAGWSIINSFAFEGGARRTMVADCGAG